MGGATIFRQSGSIPSGGGPDIGKIQIWDYGGDDAGTRKECVAGRDRCCSRTSRLFKVRNGTPRVAPPADETVRFNVQYAEELYAQQPIKHSPGVWKYVGRYRSR